MSENKAPPLIFDDSIRAIRRRRAQNRTGHFFLKRCAQDAADRLLDINRKFEQGLIIGHKGFKAHMLAALPADKQPKSLLTQADMDDIAPQSLDLALSILHLQSENDPVGVLMQLHQKLKPDGFLLAAMFGGNTLTELRQAFYRIDQERFNGVTPRIFPYADHTQAAQLLTRAGLALPVVDKDKFQILYKKSSTLISDLRDLGETNCLSDRDPRYLGRDIYQKLETAYPREDKTGKYPAQFEILWLTGWAPHKSQQIPLKPGSAKMRLSEALKQKR